MEARIEFEAGSHSLEGLFSAGNGEKGAVITHPHPRYGGDMGNPVVEAAALACQRGGYATLRFNFRGVGRSGGRYDHGKGEADDVRAALARMRAQGIRKVDLYGYSFGAWVNGHLDCRLDRIDRMVMISPPVDFLDFAEVGPLPCLRLAVVGDEDEFADTGRVRAMLDRCNRETRLEIIPNTDHFYGGALRDLERILTDFTRG
jgi:uncharacterized protein